MNFDKKYVFLLLMAVSLASNGQEPTQTITADTVLTRWDGDQVFTVGDVDSEIASAPEIIKKDLAGDIKGVTKLMENIQANRTLANQAHVLGLDATPEIKTKIKLAVEKILAYERLKKFEADLQQPDYDLIAKEKYLASPDKFRVPEKVRAAHILITKKGRTDEEAKKLAEELRTRALTGEDFTALAEKYSEDPSVKNNKGDLGFFVEAAMVKPFAEAAFGLKKPGDISDIVKTTFGYHIILLKDRNPSHQKSYDEVKDNLIKAAKTDYVTARKMEFISTIKNDPSIKIDDKAISGYLSLHPKN